MKVNKLEQNKKTLLAVVVQRQNTESRLEVRFYLHKLCTQVSKRLARENNWLAYTRYHHTNQTLLILTHIKFATLTRLHRLVNWNLENMVTVTVVRVVQTMYDFVEKLTAAVRFQSDTDENCRPFGVQIAHF